MLLVHFGRNPKFNGRERITTMFKNEYITLQLATEDGERPLDDETMIGSWKLTQEKDPKVCIHVQYTL